jgi:hypothetical protein
LTVKHLAVECRQQASERPSSPPKADDRDAARRSGEALDVDPTGERGIDRRIERIDQPDIVAGRGEPGEPPSRVQAVRVGDERESQRLASVAR